MTSSRSLLRRLALSAIVLVPTTSLSPLSVSPVVAATKTATNDVPKVVVTDLRTGKPVNLPSIVDGKKPILVWFWAPH